MPLEPDISDDPYFPWEFTVLSYVDHWEIASIIRNYSVVINDDVLAVLNFKLFYVRAVTERE